MLSDFLQGKPILDIARERGLSLCEVLQHLKSEQAQVEIEAAREASRMQYEALLDQSRVRVLQRLMDLALRTKDMGIDPGTSSGVFLIESIRKACSEILRRADGRSRASSSSTLCSGSVSSAPRTAAPTLNILNGSSLLSGSATVDFDSFDRSSPTRRPTSTTAAPPPSETARRESSPAEQPEPEPIEQAERDLDAFIKRAESVDFDQLDADAAERLREELFEHINAAGLGEMVRAAASQRNRPP